MEPHKKKADHFETQVKIKPKQFFQKVEQLKEDGSPNIAYHLFDQYPDKEEDNYVPLDILRNAGFKVYDASKIKEHIPAARSVVDLHIEKLVDKFSHLTNAEILQIQLSEFEKKTNKQKVDDLAKVFGDISTLSKSNNKDLFYVGQAAAVAQATIQGYQAVAFALGSAPPPFNFALAALVGVASAANVANILSTSPPALATGASFVDGQNGVDKIPAFLSRGERVFTTEQNKDFSRFLASEGNNASILGAIFDRLGSLESGVIVNIGGKSLVKTLNDEIAAGQVINV